MTEHGFPSAADVRLAVLTGFMGDAASIANVAPQNVFGQACLFAGMALGCAGGPA